MKNNSLFEFEELYELSNLYSVKIHYWNKIIVDVITFDDLEAAKTYAYKIIKDDKVEYVEFNYILEKHKK